MATLAELQDALVNAHNAGANDDARQLADAIVAARKTALKPSSEDPGFLKTIPIAAGKTFDNVLNGLTQMYLGARGEKGALAGLKQNVDANEAIYKPLAEARPWATGIGEALPSMAVPLGGSATLLGNAGRMAVAGGLPGALEYGSVDERANRGLWGAGAGAALPLLGAVGKTAWSGIEPMLESGRNAIVGRTLNRAAGNAAPEVAARLQSAAPVLTGSIPTSAQVAQSGGIAAMERAASAMNPEAYTQRAMEQASARLDALRFVAGTDADMAAAKVVREAVSAPLYKAADMGVAPVDGFFKGLQMRPQFQSAISRAQELAKNDGLTDIFFRGQGGEPQALIGQGAHYIKKALDEAAEHGSATYTGTQGAIAAKNTGNLFQQWLDKSIPEYKLAKDKFATASKPINQMEIGQTLLEKVKPALSDYGAFGQESAANYARALRSADQTAASATGFPGAKLADVMTPGQMGILNSVAEDLARKTNAQNLGRGVGSDTFQKLSMANIANQSGMPRLIGGLLDLPGVSNLTKWAYRDTDQKMQGLLSDALLNPKKAAALMQKADTAWMADHPMARRMLEQAAVKGSGAAGLSLLSQSANQ